MPETNTSRASLKSTASNSSDTLYHVKLLSALRSGDPALIHPFLTEIGKQAGANDGESSLGAAALHLAIRCASLDTVSLLLAHRAIPPNAIHPPGSGTTALHLAASIGRADVVRLLLDQPAIDDTLRDARGKTCLDVAKGKPVVRAIQDSRAFLNASYRSLLRTYILSPPTTPPPAALVTMLDAPRIRLVDLSYLDDASGTTLLHEAARRKDLRLIEHALRAGADVFVRDRRGKPVTDAAGKDDRVKAFLRQYTNQDTTLIDENASAPPPDLKGYLNKYTNVARGYNTRWFVLKDGVLSYYRHQEDETVASRGSIAMKTAVLKIAPNGSKLHFEVHSTPSRGHHSGVQKWYLKANHPVEAARWTQGLGKSIIWYKKQDPEQGLQPPTPHPHPHGHSHSTASDSVRRQSVDSSTSGMARARSRISGTFSKRRTDSLLPGGVSGSGSVTSFSGTATGDEGDMSAEENARSLHDVFVPGRGDDDADEDSASGNSLDRDTPPHEAAFALQGNATAAQMEMTVQLLAGLAAPSSAPSGRAVEVRTALGESLATAHVMLTEFVDMARERDEWWKAALERERARQTLWEESLKVVVQEGAAMESELRTRSRRRSRAATDSIFRAQADGEAATRGNLRLRGPQSPRIVESLDGEAVDEGLPGAVSAPITAEEHPASTSPPSARDRSLPPPPIIVPAAPPARVMDSDEEDSEDEFFDAIESGTLPNLVVTKSLAKGGVHTEPTLPSGMAEPYAGYSRLRDRLAITSDDRPPMSLWAVLKGSIGKDLTKISFPVFFNEPTSMLQRMAEDMEFSECLDAAAAERDPHRRIAFVAAYAMSNYSSTIGRIAKPFNPMLAETFEYVRLDKEYRYVSEQVSHHPPISACWAESPTWHYFGEVDAQNKFMGKSFEIRPTGIAHAELKIPEDWAPSYPKAPGKMGTGKVLEHYSWKKVTTNVSGFILGQPTIDHYGDMIITNHRTKDQCILTFKPRGWRGRDAFEISGHVMDWTGKVTYEVAGRWNSQLVARRAGADKGSLNPDVSVHGPASPSASPEYVLLWRNSTKPPAPFNLTPFAITLNDCPDDTLRPFLPPTDCRLRPDQRAFELGKYERANELKIAQEEHQRATRKMREDGRLAPHRPRWFRAETDGDTGERVWSPSRTGDALEYWEERERIWASGGTPQAAWTDVDRIFVEDEI